ncbi:MAG: twin-arginine translocase TatA/TatE family subunit [Streptosporangiaceae bacterium]
MSFFDAPWHIIILLVVVLLLFGSSRLPGAAKALGQSMNIFKKSIRGMDEEDGQNTTTASFVQSQQLQPQPPAQPITAPRADPSQQAQIEELQRQLQELQRQSAANGSAANGTAAQPQQPSS